MFIFLIPRLELVAIEKIDYHFSFTEPPSRERGGWVVSLWNSRDFIWLQESQRLYEEPTTGTSV